jgi:hypothetical protein
LSEEGFRKIDSVLSHEQRTTRKKGAQFIINAPARDTGAFMRLGN